MCSEYQGISQVCFPVPKDLSGETMNGRGWGICTSEAKTDEAEGSEKRQHGGQQAWEKTWKSREAGLETEGTGHTRAHL